jgi:hypothetical protein
MQMFWNQILRSPPNEGAPGEGDPGPTPSESGGGGPSDPPAASDDAGGGEGGDFSFMFEDKAEPASLSPPREPSAPKEGGGEPAPTPAPEKPSKPQTPGPLSSDQVKETKPAEAAASPPKPAEPAKPTQPEPTAGSKQDDTSRTESLLESADKHRDKIIENLATSKFKLSEAEVQAFESGDPAEIVPKLLARVYFEAARTAFATVEQFVPQMVAGAVQAHKAQTDTVSEFFTENKDLEPHRGEVERLGKLLRDMNPEMPRKDFAPLLAQHARTFLKLPNPSAQPAPTPMPTPAPKVNGGFTPAISAAPGIAPVATQAVSEWDFLDLEPQ